MKKIVLSAALVACQFVAAVSALGFAKTEIRRIESFPNVRNPSIAYWFFSKELLVGDKYLADLDRLAANGKFDLLFLTARSGLSFYDYAKMRPVFEKLVARAHEKGIRIGLQLWENPKPVDLANVERVVSEAEITLDAAGAGAATLRAAHIRDKKSILRAEILKAWAFRKTSGGSYDPKSLRDVTTSVETAAISADKAAVDAKIDLGASFAGQTVYLTAQHYCRFSSNHGDEAASRFIEAIDAYKSVPFDGFGLDEYTNARVSPPWEIAKTGEPDFRERYFSPAMANRFAAEFGTGQDALERALFDMRYSPDGAPEVRIRAINRYMATMREGTLRTERAVIARAREVFGPKIFAGLHETHHNALDTDEFWATGINWWRVPRDIGQTDETTPTPTQIGIAKSYPSSRVLYNMFYSKSLDAILEKALTDLRYGIRTHYHAINDIQNWGVSVDRPDALEGIGRVENCARLLNRFDPPLPRTPVLVVFGVEALSNWYPEAGARGPYDTNIRVAAEAKAEELWKAGYPAALVPTDVIADGRLTATPNGKASLNGHLFDAVVFLHPQYSRPATFAFLEKYVAGGGKLMLDGPAADRDFDGRDISARFRRIASRAVVSGFSVDGVKRLGASPTLLSDGAVAEDGSFVFTDFKSLSGATPAGFSARVAGVVYAGEYHGLAAVKADARGRLEKFAAAGLRSLSIGGRIVLAFDEPVDVYVERRADGGYIVTTTGSPSVERLSE